MSVNLNAGQMTAKQALSMGDAALRSGARDLALRFYSALLEKAPTAAHLVSRLGLLGSKRASVPAQLDALIALEKLDAPVFLAEGLATWGKVLPFLDDRRFADLAATHSALLPVANWHWNLQTVLWALQQVREVEGDFVELGVFKGHTTLFCAEYLEFAGWPRRWFLYDTFEGIPHDQMDPGWEERNARAYNANTFSYEEVRDRFAAFPNIVVTKGRAPEVLADGAPEKIAFLHVDMNNVAAEIASLDLLFDRISPGGIIVFDDYGWVAARAQHTAEKAWFAERGFVVLTMPTGQGLFVKQA